MARQGRSARGWACTLAVLGCLAALGPAVAADLSVSGDGGALGAAIAAADPHDRLIIEAGVYKGPLVIDKPLALIGRPGAIVDGGGVGRVISVSAPHVVVRGLSVRRSGESLSDMDAGIFVDADGDDALIDGNRLDGNLFGIYLQGPERAIVRDNVVIGRQDLRMSERGNGVSVWNSPGSQVNGNDFEFGRDGIFVNTSRENKFLNNRFRKLRFAIHYMNANDSEVSGNVSIGNHVGFALMFSARLKVRENVSLGDRDHGLLFNFTNQSEIDRNTIRNGGEKCVFIYNSSKNTFTHNLFEGCEIGVHFTAGSERNTLSENAFIGNRTQVKYVGTQWLEWSANGRGNYWSDHPAFDLDGDGIADTPYRPNGVVDRLLWAHPLAKALTSSPAVLLLRWVQSRFPGLHPGGVVDSAPLMTPPARGAPANPWLPADLGMPANLGMRG